jgi:hypothetical protein
MIVARSVSASGPSRRVQGLTLPIHAGHPAGRSTAGIGAFGGEAADNADVTPR